MSSIKTKVLKVRNLVCQQYLLTDEYNIDPLTGVVSIITGSAVVAFSYKASLLEIVNFLRSIRIPFSQAPTIQGSLF